MIIPIAAVIAYVSAYIIYLDVVAAVLFNLRAFGFKISLDDFGTQEQIDILKNFGCSVHQGYLFSKPKSLKI